MTFLFRCVIVFALATASDICFTLYIRRSGEGRALAAAIWSGLIAAFGAFNVVSYIEDRRLLAPVIAGYFLGTYLAVRHDTKQAQL